MGRWGLLGLFIVSQWIIPENSLLSTSKYMEIWEVSCKFPHQSIEFTSRQLRFHWNGLMLEFSAVFKSSGVLVVKNIKQPFLPLRRFPERLCISEPPKASNSTFSCQKLTVKCQLTKKKGTCSKIPMPNLIPSHGAESAVGSMTAVLRVIRAALQPIREKEMPCRAISNSSDKLSFHCCSLVTAEMLDLRCSNWRDAFCLRSRNQP